VEGCARCWRIHDILSKSLGTQNPINLVKATVAGLRGLRTPKEVAELRGLSINKVLGLTEAPANGAAVAAESVEPVAAESAAAEPVAVEPAAAATEPEVAAPAAAEAESETAPAAEESPAAEVAPAEEPAS
jgi:small subunit ribosomal protein S5